MKVTSSKTILIYEDKRNRKPVIEWLASLDITTRARIENKILRLHHGNYGDYKSLQEGVKELRLHFGSGYRVYFAEDGHKIVILLCGGDKKTQAKDIQKAIGFWNTYKEQKNG